MHLVRNQTEGLFSDPPMSKKCNDFTGTISADSLRKGGHKLMSLLSTIPIESRPRERGLRFGVETLDEAELLAIFIRSGTKGINAIELARGLLNRFQGSIRNLSQASYQELLEIKGLGPCKALIVQSLGEWARRYSVVPISNSIPIQTSIEVYNYCNEKICNQNQEHLIVLLLDIKKRLLGEHLISIGGLKKVEIEAREVFKPAIKRGAAGVILIHNHPSGDPSPSVEDERITAKLKKVGELLGIPLIDHLIIGRGGYFSFSDARLYKIESLHQ